MFHPFGAQRVNPLQPPEGFEWVWRDTLSIFTHHPPHQAWTHQVAFCQAEKPHDTGVFYASDPLPLPSKGGNLLHSVYQMFVIIWSLTSIKLTVADF